MKVLMKIKQLIKYSIFLFLQISVANAVDLSSQTCAELQSTAQDIHLNCIQNSNQLNSLITSYINNKCYLIDVYLIDLSNATPNELICYVTHNSIQDLNMHLFYLPFELRDVWTSYVSKGCNNLGNNICAIDINGINIYNPCFTNNTSNNQSVCTPGTGTPATTLTPVATPIPLEAAPPLPMITTTPAPTSGVTAPVLPMSTPALQAPTPVPASMGTMLGLTP